MYFTVCVPSSGDVYCGVYLVVVLCTVLFVYLVGVLCTVLCVYLVVVLCTWLESQSGLLAIVNNIEQ